MVDRSKFRGLAQRIVRAAKKQGCKVHVCTDGETIDNETQNETDIVDAMHCADEHHVTFWIDGVQRGWMFWLPDCDHGDVEEAIVDHTVSDLMEEIVNV